MESVKYTQTKILENWYRVGVLTPEVSIGNIPTNTARIMHLYQEACLTDTALSVTPELAVTGYSLGDLLHNEGVIKGTHDALQTLSEATRGYDTVLVAGAPLIHHDKLYNCGVVIADGAVKGVVPKQYLPNYNEFYEQRWFKSGKGAVNDTIIVAGQEVPFGTDLLFKAGDMPFGVEICEDVWVADPPSRRLAEAGAKVIANLSASPEIVGKATKRRERITQTAGRLLCAYVYASSDSSESTSDIVMSGHSIIAEFDNIQAERLPLSADQRLITADIDLAHINYERRHTTSWEPSETNDYRIIDCLTKTPELRESDRFVDPHPFIPSDGSERFETCSHILNLQAHGLAKRMRILRAQSQTDEYPKIVLGLSGGLDSTQALLAGAKACDLLGIDRSSIYTFTLPAHASSERTQSNAGTLAQAIGTTHQEIPIQDLVNQQLTLMEHDGMTQDLTYENTQARTRTEFLFNKSNQVGGLLLGTGDLSELALGWCTYNGDQMSSYAINADVPKSLVRYVVDTVSDMPEFVEAKAVLQDILETPVSPELTGNGDLSQTTEDIVGPYELHDFFLYHLLRWGSDRKTIEQLATQAFAGSYSETEVTQWLNIFCRRFTTQQFKRNCMPDGVKLGRVALSPRGDWRMPSDADLGLLLSV